LLASEFSASAFSELALYSGEDEMSKKPLKDAEGYALRGGKFMRGLKPLRVDPELVELCLSSGLSSGTLLVPGQIGDRILRIATFISALRKLENGQERRLPNGNE
jgi:hypothetical protein